MKENLQLEWKNSELYGPHYLLHVDRNTYTSSIHIYYGSADDARLIERVIKYWNEKVDSAPELEAKRTMTYDPKCYDLAEEFLADNLSRPELNTKENREKLAEEIQRTIEDFLNFLED